MTHVNQEDNQCFQFTEGARCRHCGKTLEYQELSTASLGTMRFPIPCICEVSVMLTEETKKEVRLQQSDRTLKDIEKLMAYGPQGLFKQRTFTNFKQEEPWQAELFAKLKNYADNFDQKLKDMRGILLLGTVGVGKTHLAASVANTLRNKNIPVVFGTLGYLYERIQSTYSNRFSNEHMAQESDMMRLFATVPLMIIDDLGKEYSKGDNAWSWGKSKLYEIINRRYENGLPVIVTSNIVDTDELISRTDSGIVSRLLEMCEIISVSGGDYRAKSVLKNGKTKIQA